MQISLLDLQKNPLEDGFCAEFVWNFPPVLSPLDSSRRLVFVMFDNHARQVLYGAVHIPVVRHAPRGGI